MQDLLPESLFESTYFIMSVYANKKKYMVIKASNLILSQVLNDLSDVQAVSGLRKKISVFP